MKNMQKLPGCFIDRITDCVPWGLFRGRFTKPLAVLLLALGGWLLTGLETRAANDPEAVPDELIVIFKKGVHEQEKDAVHNAHGDQNLESLDGINGRLIKVTGNRSLAQANQEYRGHTNVVLYVQPNYIYHANIIPNDKYFPNLWAMQNTSQPVNGKAGGTSGADIEATLAWDLAWYNNTIGTKDVVVGVVDTGVDYNHPDLAANIWSNPGGIGLGSAGTHGYNAIRGTYDPMDDNGHGTHVSGTIGAAGGNSIGVVGVNWTTSIMGLKFLDSKGNGTTANAIKAIDFAVKAKSKGVNVRVLNASWGGGSYDASLLAEIQMANDNGILFVAAAGNNGTDNDTSPSYPANYSVQNVIAVAATDNNDSLASFSNYGATTVELGAPGVDIASTWPRNQYAYESGTSMATPHVTGAAALILAYQKDHYQRDLTLAQLKDAILNNVDKIPSLNVKTFTGGRLNVYKAVANSTPMPDFSISISQSSTAVACGGSSSYTVTVTPLNGFSGNVTLSSIVTMTSSGLLDQTVTTTLNPGTVVLPSSSPVTLTAITTASTPLGTDTITVTGTVTDAAGQVTYTHTATASLVVSIPSSAGWVKSDTTAQGNWVGKYGSEGYDIVHFKSPPSYANITYSNVLIVDPWQVPIDQRVLQIPDGSSRYAAVYYQFGVFSFDVSMTDDQMHRVSLYCVDMDRLGRMENISIVDANTGSELVSAYSLDSFGDGQYVTWNISGHVLINVKWIDNSNSGIDNAVVSGLFFDPVIALPPLPEVPTGLIASPGNAQVTLTWTESTGATSYNVKRSTVIFGPYTSTGTSTTVSYTDSTALNGTTYYYVVSAVNEGGESANSTPVSATTPDFTISANPTSSSVTRGSSATYTVTVGTSNGEFSGTVGLSVSGLPSGATATFSPTSVTTTTGSVSSTLKITTKSNTPRGTFNLTITGKSGTLTHTTKVTLKVN
jgi:subtilisin family serine protease